MRIAMNTCRDTKRSSWFRFVDRKTSIEAITEQVQEPELDSADDLTRAILLLPTKYKEVILLYYYQDMNMQEVANTLNIAVSTVAKRIKQACAKLEHELGKEYAYEA